MVYSKLQNLIDELERGNKYHICVTFFGNDKLVCVVHVGNILRDKNVFCRRSGLSPNDPLLEQMATGLSDEDCRRIAELIVFLFRPARPSFPTRSPPFPSTPSYPPFRQSWTPTMTKTFP